VTTSTEIDVTLAGCDVVVLAVKPQIMREVAQALVPHIREQLVLSVAAGIRTADLSRWLAGYSTIVRTMPNTPALIGQGVTGIYATATVTDTQKQVAQALMQTTGQTLWVSEESLLDVVTAISGSGPAYVFYFIEALVEAGKMLGLDEEQANRLAIATFRGASELASQSSESVSVLRENVTSPAGTTFAALSLMEENGLKDRIIEAAKAAFARSVELGSAYGSNS
jgi:pyrroline-5-carboxylate reductase